MEQRSGGVLDDRVRDEVVLDRGRDEVVLDRGRNEVGREEITGETVPVLIERAEAGLERACHATLARDRYVEAHRAALRAATAVVAARRRTLRPRLEAASSVWELLASAAPELTEWADFFAFATARRAHLDSPTAVISVRSADDLVRAAQSFVGLAAKALGLPGHLGDLRLRPLTR